MKKIKDLEEIVDEVIAEDTSALLEIKAGVRPALDRLVVEVMRRSGRKADPKEIKYLILKKL